MRKIILGLWALGVVSLAALLVVTFYNHQSGTVSFRNAEGQMQQFYEFMQQYRKQYFNEEELLYRYKIFTQKKKQAEEHNKKGLGWTKAINRFSDLTDYQFKHYYLGYKKHQVKVPMRKFEPDTVYEDSIDWNQRGALTPIKDQGTCGSCWAFSTTGGVEGAYQIKTGNLASFSEQQLVDCATSAYGNAGCDGGDLPGSFKYFKDFGVETETSYPYNGYDGICSYNQEAITTRVSNFESVQQYSDQALKQALNSQPVSVCIDSTALASYSSGIVDVNACGVDAEIDHCVLLYGYNSNEYWMLKNSWGTWWGEEGYFRFAQGGNTCCIQQEAMTVTLN